MIKARIHYPLRELDAYFQGGLERGTVHRFKTIEGYKTSKVKKNVSVQFSSMGSES